jgi:hypothetical protein
VTAAFTRSPIERDRRRRAPGECCVGPVTARGLLRHYTAVAGIAHGQKTRRCFDKLVMRIGMRDLCEFSATLECVRY